MLSCVLLLLTVLSALLAIIADWGRRGPAFYLFKPLTTVLIIALCLSWTHSQGTAYSALILGGLVLCLAGDVFLMGRNQRSFLCGLGAFLIAHLIFMLAFLQGVELQSPPLWTAALALWGLPLALRVLPRAGRLSVPVAIYGLVLFGMTLTAALRHDAGGDLGSQWALAGALLFVLSDSLLAIRKFAPPALDLQPPLLASYWAAIALIAISV